jgi:protein SCO1/2
MFSHIRALLPGLAFVVALAGCKPAADSTGGKEYDIEGKIVSISADGSEVAIDHKAIAGLMRAMEMKFRVAEPGVVKGLKAGDAVKGRLRVHEGGYTILKLQAETSS